MPFEMCLFKTVCLSVSMSTSINLKKKKKTEEIKVACCEGGAHFQDGASNSPNLKTFKLKSSSAHNSLYNSIL